MPNTRRVRQSKDQRRGTMTLELLFAAPVLFLLLLAAVSYSQASIIRSGVAQAATVAAREAGKGASPRDVAVAVDRVLHTCGLRLSRAAGSGTAVVLQDGVQGVWHCGDPGLRAKQLAKLHPEEVLATVRINASGAMGARSLLGRLGGMALAFQGNEICISSIARKASSGS